jgi:hypothetical protein
MKFGIISLLLIIVFNSKTLAQVIEKNLSGKVKDETGKPVSGANVLLLGEKSAVVRASVTGNEGEYTLESIKEGEYTLKIVSAGFEVTTTKVLVSSDSLIAPIVLKKQTKQLDEVAIRSSRPFIEVRPDRLIVNVENSITAAGSSAMEVLQKSPGVRVDQNDNISLKGKQGVIIWINGKPTPMAGEDLANMLKSMPAASIDKIELISNPGARYDAAGSAGIINIIMKKDKRKGVNGSVNANYGQGVYSKMGAGGTINYRKNKLNLSGSYNFSKRYWFNHLMLNRKFLDTAASNFNNQLQRYDQDNYALFDFNNHIATVAADYSINKKTTVGISANGATNVFNPEINNVSKAFDASDNLQYNFNTTGNHANSYFNYATNFYIKHSFDTNGREINLDLDYASFGNQSNQNFITRYTKDNLEYLPDYFLKSDLTGSTRIHSIKSDYIHPLKNGIKLELGVKSSYVVSDNDAVYWQKTGSGSSVDYVIDNSRTNHFIYKENINAAYLNTGKDWKKWGFQAGVRMENTNVEGNQVIDSQKFETSYVQLFPSFAVQYHLNPENDLGITLSRRIERPNYQQLNPFKYFIDKTTYREGYIYLQPASFYSVELSHTLKQKYQTTFTVGINKGIITQVIQPSEVDTLVTVQTNKNLDRMLFIGLSGTYPIQIRKWWSNVTSYNAYYARYEGNIANTPLRDGSPTIEINTNNTFILPKEFSAELGWIFQARQTYGYMDVNPNWMLNAGIQKQIMKRTATIRLNVQDIFWTGYPSATSTYLGYSEDFIAQRETRVVNLSFTYRFGSRPQGPARRRSGGAEEEKNRARDGAA